MSTIQEIYRRNQPNPLAKSFRLAVTYAADMNTTLTPGTGKIILIDKIVFSFTANLSSTVTWQIKSTVAGATGETGIYNNGAGDSFFTFGGASMDVVLAGFDEVHTAAMGSLATNLIIATAHIRPPIKLTASEGLVVYGTGGILSAGTGTITLHGWYLNDSEDY